MALHAVKLKLPPSECDARRVAKEAELNANLAKGQNGHGQAGHGGA